MKQIEGRRKIIFGLGAFAAGIFLPVNRLIFPVANNPLGDEGIWRFEAHCGEFKQNRTGNKRAFLWLITERIPTKVGRKGYSEEMRLSARFRSKLGCAPDHPMDGDWAQGTFQEALELTRAGKMRFGGPMGPDSMSWEYEPGKKHTNELRKSNTAFKREVFRLERKFETEV